MKSLLYCLLVVLISSCSSTLMVNGVEVERLPEGSDKLPAVCTLEISKDDAFNKCKLILAKNQFPITSDDRSIGLIQTGFKALSPDEHFELNEGTKMMASVVMDVTKITQQGRLTIIIESIDSSLSKISITGYLKVAITQQKEFYFNKNTTETEEQVARLHPLVQKYLCAVQDKNCGPAPGQKILIRENSSFNNSGW
ncbi:MAG: hypothetical protein V1779_09905 [bacterium]